jgi:signal transduction histidine kinase
LTVQIVLWTVLPLTLALIAVAFTGVYSHERAMRDLVEERDRALAVVGASQMAELLRSRAQALASLATAQPFYHADPTAGGELLAEAGTLGGRFAGELALLDGEGKLLTSGGPPPAWTQARSLPELASEAVSGQEVALSPLFDAAWGTDVMLMGVPVRDHEGQVYGMLAGPLALADLKPSSLLDQVQVGEHSIVYLVDNTGRVLAHTSAGPARHSLEGHTGLEVALESQGSGATLCLAPDGERMTMAYAPVSFAGLAWRVLIEEPWQEVVGPVLRYSQFMPIVVALGIIVSVLTLYYGVRSIVRPLQALGSQAERVAWGDFEATGTPVGGVEEIEDLRRTLDQMARRIQSYQRGMHDYIAAMTQGQEEERRRLARELHDETVQALVALGHQVEMAQKLLSSDPQQAAGRLAEVQVLLADTVEGIRRFSRDLRPIYLEDLGFLPALEMLAREADRQGGLRVHLVTDGLVRRLPPDLELAAYRIAQEALNNVTQHAGAANAWVEVRFESSRLILAVRDDGQGFEAPDLPDALARQGRFGLMGIQERAMLYGGQMALRSAPGGGTEVTVKLPYPDTAP